MSLPPQWHLPLDPGIPNSLQSDPTVPPFPGDRPLIVFDGVCVLCSGFVQWVIRHDRHQQFLFASAQSSLGQAIYRHLGLPTDMFETNLLIDRGLVYGKTEAFFRIMHRLGAPWALLALGRILPPPVRNWLYDRIARNRYRLFGRTDACMIPAPEIAARFIG